ncbi:MAG: hypothetical protein H0W61_09485 [Bacteroidetes bacterium]|nr:hypothetical protein [Bacteroidota bacterium]
MKQAILVLSSILIIGLGGCKHKQKTQETKKDPTPKAVEVKCAATVAFGSPGTGIDAKKYDEIKKMIESKKLKYTEKQEGREGERKICLPLTELEGSDKAAFIEQLKKSASSGQLVSVSTS